MIYMFAVSGVSAEWVNERFTSLRVSLPGGSTYRITYTSVNKSNATEPKTVTTSSMSHVVKDFRPDWFYTVMVEAVSLDSVKVLNGSIGIGEQFHILLVEILLYVLLMSNCPFFVIWPAGIGIAVALAVVIIFILLGLCCCWLARQVEQHFAHILFTLLPYYSLQACLHKCYFDNCVTNTTVHASLSLLH